MPIARIKRWLSKDAPPAAPVAIDARGPAGVRLYAIGDIHGRLDLLRDLMQRIEADARQHAGPIQVVFLGDYVDRGPHSAEVIDWLVNNCPRDVFRSFLRGNHEELLLQLWENELSDDSLSAWLSYGGRETLSSYGIGAAIVYSDDLMAIRSAAVANVPTAHHQFLRELKNAARFGDFFFAHAGIRPGIPLEAQSANDLLWIREPFLSSREDHGAVVVHGHSIAREVQERGNRIGIDTGAYATGRLTALCVLEGERWFLSTGA